MAKNAIIHSTEKFQEKVGKIFETLESNLMSLRQKNEIGMIEFDRLFANEINIAVKSVGTIHIYVDFKHQTINLESPTNGPHVFEWNDQQNGWCDHRKIFTLEWVMQNEFKNVVDTVNIFHDSGSNVTIEMMEKEKRKNKFE